MTSSGSVRRLLVSHGLAAVAMSMPWPLLLVLVWDRVGDSADGPLLLGLAGAARMLPYVLLSWATGSLGDRFRRDSLLRATLATRIVLLTVVALAVAQGWLLVAVLGAAAAVASGTPAYPLLAAAMPHLAGDARRRATDTLVTIEVAAFAVGPALGGLLLVDATRPWICATAVAMAGTALLLVLGVAIPAAPGRQTQTASLRAMVLLVGRTPSVLAAVAVVALLNLVIGACALVLLPIAEDVWHEGAGGYGLATGWLGFGALAAPLLWWLGGSAAIRRRRGLVVLGLALAAVPLVPVMGWALPLLALVGAASVQVESAVTETIQDGVPDERRAGVLGLTDSVMVGAAMVGSLLAPWLASAVGARASLLLIAAVTMTGWTLPNSARSRHHSGIAIAPTPRQPQRRFAPRATSGTAE